jgi:hypothetical protein
MLLDALVSFSNAPFSIVAGAGVATPSSVIDLLGLGSGVAPVNIIGNNSVFGQDPGIGWPRGQAQVIVTTAFTTATAATMNFIYQGAPDSGSGGGYLPGTWQTIVESGYLAVTDLDSAVATDPDGAIAWQFDFEPTHPISFRPRFLRVLCQPLAATLFTAGAVRIPTTLGLDQFKQKFQGRNYTVGPTA